MPDNDQPAVHTHNWIATSGGWVCTICGLPLLSTAPLGGTYDR